MWVLRHLPARQRARLGRVATISSRWYPVARAAAGAPRGRRRRALRLRRRAQNRRLARRVSGGGWRKVGHVAVARFVFLELFCEAENEIRWRVGVPAGEQQARRLPFKPHRPLHARTTFCFGFAASLPSLLRVIRALTLATSHEASLLCILRLIFHRRLSHFRSSRRVDVGRELRPFARHWRAIRRPCEREGTLQHAGLERRRHVARATTTRTAKTAAARARRPP